MTERIDAEAAVAEPLELDQPAGDGALTTATVKGGAWRAVSVLGGAVVQFLVAVVLARLLEPEDFGTIAIVLVLLGLAQTLSYLGVGPALVQRRVLSPEDVRTAWTIACLIGVGAACLFAAAGPLFAAIVGPAADAEVFIAMSPVLLFLGWRMCSLALLRRALRFKALVVVDLGSYVLGYAAVAIGGALAGWGLWALVAGTLVQGALATGAAYAFVRHPLRLGIDRGAARELVGFGGGMTASGLANYVALNGDYFVVGRVLGAAPLGLYTRAYHLMNLPLSHIAQVLSQVLLPAYSRVQGDKVRLARGYLASVYLVFLLSSPIMMFVVLAAPRLVPFLYGPKWNGVVAPLQVLAVFGAFRATYHLGGAVVQACGRPWSEFTRQLVYATLVVVGSLIGAHWGLTGVAAAVGVAIVVMYAAMAHLAHQVAGFTWRAFAAAHRSGLAAAAAVLAVGLPLRLEADALGWHDVPVLVLLGVVMVAALVAAIGLLPLSWRPRGVDRALASATRLLPGRAGTAAQRVMRVRGAEARA